MSLGQAVVIVDIDIRTSEWIVDARGPCIEQRLLAHVKGFEPLSTRSRPLNRSARFVSVPFVGPHDGRNTFGCETDFVDVFHRLCCFNRHEEFRTADG